jgi:putative oxidoreductase
VTERSQARLLIPGLRAFYDAAVPLAWVVVRVAVGWNLVVHGWGKIVTGPTPGFLKAYVDLGFSPPLPWFWAAFSIEFIGGVALILGLATRFFAAAAAIELLIITVVYWKNGFGWARMGYEYTLMWGLVCFAIALRGGGEYSLDRKIGVEL